MYNNSVAATATQTGVDNFVGRSTRIENKLLKLLGTLSGIIIRLQQPTPTPISGSNAQSAPPSNDLTSSFNRIEDLVDLVSAKSRTIESTIG